MVDVLWNFFHTPEGITILTTVASVIGVWVKAKFFPASTKWEKYKGYIITGVKWAEKQIPDNTPNKSAKRADEALKFIIESYEKANNGVSPTAALTAQIVNAIPVIHAELEAAGVLSKKAE